MERQLKNTPAPVIILTIRLSLKDFPLKFASPKHLIWQIGQDNQSGAGFALYPDGYKDFISKDFKFSASELLKGGSLVLEMGPEPNEKY